MNPFDPLGRFGNYALPPYDPFRQIATLPGPPGGPPATAPPPARNPLVERLLQRMREPSRDPGERRGVNRGTASAGYLPGRQLALGVLGALVPGPLGTALSAINAGLGLTAGRQQLDLMGQFLGRRLSPSFGDMLAAATGIGGGAYSRGLGGYGNIGVGGYRGLMDMMDPGVMGPARAMAASFVDARNPAGSRAGGASGGANRGGSGTGGGPTGQGARVGRDLNERDRGLGPAF